MMADPNKQLQAAIQQAGADGAVVGAEAVVLDASAAFREEEQARAMDVSEPSVSPSDQVSAYVRAEARVVHTSPFVVDCFVNVCF